MKNAVTKNFICNLTFAGSFLFCFSGFAQTAEVPDPPFAYATNTGWLSLHPTPEARMVANARHLEGYIYGANIGWINVGASPVDGESYSNDSGLNFGINRDPLGNLSGYAYGENIGWVSFEWAGLGDPNRPRIDPETGALLGFAYSGNIGWIQFGTDFPVRFREGDRDGDSMLDEWELNQFGELTSAGVGSDFDGDGQSDAAEAIAGSDPLDASNFFRIVDYVFDSGFTTAILQFTSQPERQYRIEQSNLASNHWMDAGLGNIFPDEGDTTTRTVTFSSENTPFLRVVVSIPESN